MYAEAGLLLPCLQDVSFINHQMQQLQEDLSSRLCSNELVDGSGSICPPSSHGHLHPFSTQDINLVEASSVLEYYFGGDMFNAPKPLVEQQLQLELNPMEAAVTMISTSDTDLSSMSEFFFGEVDLFRCPDPLLEQPQLERDSITNSLSMIPIIQHITNGEAASFGDITSIDSEQLLDEFFSDCKGSLPDNPAVEDSSCYQLDEKIQYIPKENSSEGSIMKSLSMECLMSEEWSKAGGTLGPNFIDFQQIDFGAAFGMRRAYSEGDIKTLGNGNLSPSNTSIIHHSVDQHMGMDAHRFEERKEKLSRYRMKKSTRNFGRKIQYACRKALADSQPRVRGRFARTEECDVPRLSK